MICPYCRQEMQRGYISSRDGVVWSPKPTPPVAALAIFSKGAIALEDPEAAADSARAALAYHCASCKKIIINYGEEAKTEKL